ncbi:ribonuclease Y [Sulfurovum sp.]|uniref:ribonuclease Y n=1 Tax=Sulfurovum sp. TaxID=1969726 RepID=UPI002A360C33|nr:ribonuclease Y [Sulfurovum sp.]MDD2452038.1 ribonuclease Y [Sulfurovum sp.]MDD3498768.1 ribonuclease Y [Sulfurovum sp.]MDY0402049.1 ribonuclease Y [Sulfurovum sp.]
MTETIGLSSIAGVAVGAASCYFWLKSSTRSRFSYMELESKAKAKAIEHEAEQLLESSKVKIKANEIEQEREYQKRLSQLEERQRSLVLEQKEIGAEKKRIEEKRKSLKRKERNLEKLEQKKQAVISEAIEKIEQAASLTQEEAKAYILQKVEEQSRADVANIVRKYEQEAKEEGEKKANYILAQATTRYAGEFAGERLINTITLPSDEHKGRIIGKEGRNIKSLEMLLGVDIIIDETPGVIVVSSFNLYRRAIATRVIEILVEDGRIHPARIEEVHEKVQKEFEQKTFEEGESIVIDLGLYPMAEELMRLLGRLKYRASYGQNALAHTLEVANLAKVMAANMGGDEKLALRAGLLHDIGKALTQEHGGSHVELGVELCRKYHEHPTVINAIYAHHGYEEPDSVESAAVCAADKLSAARPGARREVLESFTKRVEEIEEIATAKECVTSAYAINAGREIRVFVNADKISDSESVLLSKEIAKEIEEKVQYPGAIKVNVIRETRAAAYAK